MTEASQKKSVITIILAVSLAMALTGAGLLGFAWQNGDKQVTELENQVATLQTELTAASADKEALASQLAELEGVFPPRNFTDTDELLAWLETTVPALPEGNSLQRHLDLQKLALAEGYIWSIWVDVSNPELTYVGSHVVAGDTIYLVDTTNGAILALHTSPYFLEE
jgi:hypothetical protein